MGSGVIVIVNLLLQPTSQVRLIEHEQMIQAFLAHGSDPPLGKSIRIRGTIRSKQKRHLLGLEDRVEGRGELAISVVDQKTQGTTCFSKGPQKLARWLRDPSRGRMSGAASQVKASPAERDEAQAVDSLQK
jgi:hypothetical protein